MPIGVVCGTNSGIELQICTCISTDFNVQCIEIHLKFMAFLLQEGALYLPVKRAIDVWDTLISAPDTCPADRTVSVCMGPATALHCVSIFLMQCTCMWYMDMIVKGINWQKTPGAHNGLTCACYS